MIVTEKVSKLPSITDPSSADVFLVVSNGVTFKTTRSDLFSSPTFLTMSEGSVLFAGSAGLLSQNNVSFFWDDSVTTLKLGGQLSVIDSNSDNLVYLQQNGSGYWQQNAFVSGDDNSYLNSYYDSDANEWIWRTTGSLNSNIRFRPSGGQVYLSTQLNISHDDDSPAISVDYSGSGGVAVDFSGGMLHVQGGTACIETTGNFLTFGLGQHDEDDTENLRIGWNSSLSCFEFITEAAGTGSIRDMIFSAGKVGINVVPDSQLHIKSYDASTVGLIVQGTTSQSANLTEWQDSSGTVLVSIDASGNASFANITGGANPSASVGLSAVNGSAATFMRSDGAPALSQSIAPTWTGQHTFSGKEVYVATSDYVLGSAGSLAIFGQTTTGNTYSEIAALDNGANSWGILALQRGGGQVVVGGTTGTARLNVICQTASSVGLIVKGASSQSVNLQEWQNSSGTVLAGVDKSGGFFSTAGTSGVILSTNGASTTYGFGSSISGLATAFANGSAITSWNTTGMLLTQPANSSGSNGNGAFTITGGAHTTLTASTEAIDINFNLARTVQFATGALTTQRAMVIQAPTYGFVAASTLTNAATLAITGPPVAGTNATITNSYGLWVQSGNVLFGGSTSDSGAGLVTINSHHLCFKLTDSRNGIYTGLGSVSGVLQFFAGSNFTANAIGNASAVGWTFSPAASSGTTGAGLTYTDPAHTALTLSTERIAVNFDCSSTKQFATGALTTQREIVIQAPTYGFVGASTITTGVTCEITGAPIAGTSATITNKYALRVNTGTDTGVGIVVKANSGTQTGNLQEWQNSSGNSLLSVSATGVVTFTNQATGFFQNLTANGGFQFYTTTGVVGVLALTLTSTGIVQAGRGFQSSVSSTLIFDSGVTGNGNIATAFSASTIPLTVKGASSQSANLQEWQDSSAGILASISSAGVLSLGASQPLVLTHSGSSNTIATAASLTLSGQSGLTSIDLSNSTGFITLSTNTSTVVTTTNAAKQPLIVQGAASQTANLQEWQNSSGTAFVTIGPPTIPGDSDQFLTITGTLPTVPTADRRGVYFNITGAGSQTFDEIAVYCNLNAGYTGSRVSAAALCQNASCGTGSNPYDAGRFNSGLYAQSFQISSTTGASVGVYATGFVLGGTSTARGQGVLGWGINSVSGGIGVGVEGLATGSTTRIGGIFSIGSTGPTIGTTSCALICDNQARLNNIFEARDNGTAVFTIADNGNIAVTPAVQTGTVPIGLLYTSAAHTAFTASTERIEVNFNLSATQQFATGALTTQRAVVIQAPTYGFVAASTITTGVTCEITGAPIAGTSATITNKYALRVNTGTDTGVGVVVKANSGTQSGNLQEWQNSSGAILACVTKDGSIDIPINSSTLASIGNSSFGGNKITFTNNGSITILTPNAPTTLNSSYSSSNGQQVCLNVTPTIAQSSTAGMRCLVIDPTVSSTGSGVTYLLEALRAGSTRFSVDLNGAAVHTVGNASSIGQIIKGAASRSVVLAQLQTSAGDSLGSLGGTIFNSFTDASTTHTDGTEDDLYSYTTAANTFALDGDSVTQKEHVNLVGHATATRQVKKYFAGTLIFDSTSLTLAGGDDIWLETTVIRESSTVVRVTVLARATTISTIPPFTYTRITGLTLTGTNIIKTTGIAAGVGAASADIVNKLSKVEWESAA